MIKQIKKLCYLLIICLIFLQPVSAFSFSAEEEIWMLEEVYVAGFRDANHDIVIPIWHHQFMGWPDSQFRPVDKNGVIQYLKRVSPGPATWTFEIERQGIRISGDTAITHLTLHIYSNQSSGKDLVSSKRVTHTWVKEDSGWKILGGMSAK
jgi:hypothetical protein